MLGVARGVKNRPLRNMIFERNRVGVQGGFRLRTALTTEKGIV